MERLEYNSSNTSHENGKIQLTTYASQGISESLGILNVYFQDLIKLIDNNDACDFEIKFQARATQWQYFIINASGMQVDNLSIKGKLSIDFGQGTPVAIQSGGALLFSSGDQLLALSEVPKHQFDLINQSKTTGLKGKPNGIKTIFKGLPNPNPAKTETTVINGTTIAHQLCIYLNN